MAVILLLIPLTCNGWKPDGEIRMLGRGFPVTCRRIGLAKVHLGVVVKSVGIVLREHEKCIRERHVELSLGPQITKLQL